MKTKELEKRVFDLGCESAILSSRGWDTAKQDEELSKLYEENPEAYARAYKKVKANFGY